MLNNSNEIFDQIAAAERNYNLTTATSLAEAWAGGAEFMRGGRSQKDISINDNFRSAGPPG